MFDDARPGWVPAILILSLAFGCGGGTPTETPGPARPAAQGPAGATGTASISGTVPFFDVTETDGRFEIVNLPAGDYRIEAWHEKLGTRTADVTVADGESKAVDFVFSRG